jgi:MYXO-CTERM domain-containing protein
MSLSLGLVPLLVTGQLFGTVTLRVNDLSEVSISGASCASQLSVAYTTQLGLTAGVCSSFQIFVTDATSCPNTPATTDYIVREITQTQMLTARNQTDTAPIDVKKLPYFVKNQGDAGTACGTEGLDVRHIVCASVEMASDLSCFYAKSTLKAQTPVTIKYDTAAPAAPAIVNAEAFDSAAGVSVSMDDDTSKVDVEVKPPDGDWYLGATMTSSERTKTISGLTNGVTYELRARAFDAVQPTPNSSGYSELATVTPRLSSGFWAACREAGCPSHGCSAASGAPLALLALGLSLIRRRIRR